MVGDYTEGYDLQVTPMLANLDSDLSAGDSGVDDEYYVYEAGSIVVKCQYGGGVELHGDNVYTIANQSSKNTWMIGAHYHTLHVYIGSNSGVKCACGTYNYDDTDYSHWRC